jgi:hypothetical protein
MEGEEGGKTKEGWEGAMKIDSFGGRWRHVKWSARRGFRRKGLLFFSPPTSLLSARRMSFINSRMFADP